MIPENQAMHFLFRGMLNVSKSIIQGERYMEKRRNKLSSYTKRSQRTAFLFMTPSLIILYVFVFIPLIAAFLLGVFDINIFLTNIDFVGLKHFKKIFSDERVWNAFKNTFIFTFVEASLQVSFGFLVACMVSGTTFFQKLVRSIYFIPVVCSMTCVGLVGMMILDPNIGTIPYLISKLGFEKPMMLKDPDMALPLIILITVWKNFGQTLIILAAGLGGIGRHYYEASEIDGANKFQQTRYITVPLIWPSLSFCFVTNLIGSFQVFDIVFVATKGGPLFSTETVVQLIYSRGFSGEMNLGYASALAVILFAVIVTFTLILYGLLNRQEKKMFG